MVRRTLNNTDGKTCPQCNVFKMPGCFNFSKKRKDKMQFKCRECQRKDYLSNRDKRLKQNKNYRKENREAVRERSRNWYLNNKEKHKEKAKRFKDNNPNYMAEYNRRRKKEDIQYKLRTVLANRIKKIIKGKALTNEYIISIVGCSMPELRNHIEKMFTEGMSWENHGQNGWHIDHIKPLSLFDLTDSDEVKQANHYTNLQPLWARDNLSKGAKYVGR